MLIRQEEMQRQDELDEIALQEELQAIEIELRRQRQRMQKGKKNVQKYQFAKKLLRLFPLGRSQATLKTKLDLVCEHFTNSYFTLLYKFIFTLHIHVWSHIFCDAHLFKHAHI